MATTAAKKQTNKSGAGKKQTRKPRASSKLVVNEQALISEAQKMSDWETKRGRPVKFNAEKAIQLMEQAIDDYVSGKFKYHELIPKDAEGKKFHIAGVSYPTIIKIALMCGVDSHTFLSHCNARNEDGSLKNEQLFTTLNRFKELGNQMLIEGGLIGMYDARVVQFVGNVNYNMIPQSKVESTVEMKNMDEVYKQLDEIHRQDLERVQQQKAEMEERKRLLDLQEEKE